MINEKHETIRTAVIKFAQVLCCTATAPLNKQGQAMRSNAPKTSNQPASIFTVSPSPFSLLDLSPTHPVLRVDSFRVDSSAAYGLLLSILSGHSPSCTASVVNLSATVQVLGSLCRHRPQYCQEVIQHIAQLQHKNTLTSKQQQQRLRHTCKVTMYRESKFAICCTRCLLTGQCCSVVPCRVFVFFCYVVVIHLSALLCSSIQWKYLSCLET